MEISIQVAALGSSYNLYNYIFELSAEIFKREETMRGIKAFVILAMTAFYFPIVSWGKGTNLFVLDAQFL